MSARRATPATLPAGRCFASRSRSARSPPPSPPRSSAASADRAAPKEARQQRERAQYRPAPLPRPDRDPRAGVAVDLPGEIVDSAGEGGRRLGEANEGQRLAAPPEPAPGRGRAGPGRRVRRRREPPVALRVALDDRGRPARPLGSKLAPISER